MADRMEFPKTIQEFMDGYSFKDDKEIYTNGSRLIPVFRVEQALEHYGQEIRNKAIDDFARWMKWGYENSIGIPQYEIDYANKMINKVAEHLKAGDTDGE